MSSKVSRYLGAAKVMKLTQNSQRLLSAEVVSSAGSDLLIRAALQCVLPRVFCATAFEISSVLLDAKLAGSALRQLLAEVG